MMSVSQTVTYSHMNIGGNEQNVDSSYSCHPTICHSMLILTLRFTTQASVAVINNQPLTNGHRRGVTHRSREWDHVYRQRL